MGAKRHKRDTKEFSKLSIADQARSINADILYLKRAIRAHARKAEEERGSGVNTLKKCEKQFAGLVDWIRSRIETS